MENQQAGYCNLWLSFQVLLKNEVRKWTQSIHREYKQKAKQTRARIVMLMFCNGTELTDFKWGCLSLGI